MQNRQPGICGRISMLIKSDWTTSNAEWLSLASRTSTSLYQQQTKCRNDCHTDLWQWQWRACRTGWTCWGTCGGQCQYWNWDPSGLVCRWYCRRSHWLNVRFTTSCVCIGANEICASHPCIFVGVARDEGTIELVVDRWNIIVTRFQAAVRAQIDHRTIKNKRVFEKTCIFQSKWTPAKNRRTRNLFKWWSESGTQAIIYRTQEAQLPEKWDFHSRCW